MERTNGIKCLHTAPRLLRKTFAPRRISFPRNVPGAWLESEKVSTFCSEKFPRHAMLGDRAAYCLRPLRRNCSCTLGAQEGRADTVRGNVCGALRLDESFETLSGAPVRALIRNYSETALASH